MLLAIAQWPVQMRPMPASAPAKPDSRSPLKRLFANTAWLLGGKGFGAVCSFIYLAILARSLGLKDFGHFSLIFGAAQALIALVGFQTWRVVVRYGAAHVHARNWAAFGRLGMLAGLLDLIGAALGCLIAYIAYYHFSDVLELNPEFRDGAFLVTCLMLFALVSAPTGIVRALDRFDAAVYVEALVPAGRLIAALVIWATGPSVFRFLFAWALIDLIEAVAYWITARRLCPEAVRLRHLFRWSEARRDNPGVVRFFVITHGAATTDAATKYGPMLIAGLIAGTRSAGLYRMAQQLSQALSKLSGLLTRAAYAEINRARVASEAAEFRRFVRQTSLIAGGAGVGVILLAVLLGRPLLGLIGGEEFRQAHAVLIPLTVAACFELASVAFEPVLHSTGRARHALAARLLGLLVVIAGIIFLSGAEADGIALAVAIGGAVTYAALGLTAWRALRQLDHLPGRPLNPAPLDGPEH